MHLIRWPFQLPWGCGGTMWGALPDGAHPGLDSSKPLDASNMFSLALGISVGTRSGLDISFLLEI